LLEKGGEMLEKQSRSNNSSRDGRLGGSLPVWNVQTLASFDEALSADLTRDKQYRGERLERGCTKMTRFARVLAVLSALATVFMVAGASTKY
jgi:hypothetical protein